MSDSASDCEGRDRPFDPKNACCNAPHPPGALPGRCCDRRTRFYVQAWRCVWKQTDLEDCSCAGSDAKCAWVKAWRCNFREVSRRDVLKAVCSRRPARCAEADECECYVPEDVYFARVWELDYESCADDLLQPGDPGYDPCKPQDERGVPGGCACCGLTEVCCPRWLRIRCKADIPPLYPREPSWDCEPEPRRCVGARCAVTHAKSPDFWRAPAALY